MCVCPKQASWAPWTLDESVAWRGCGESKALSVFIYLQMLLDLLSNHVLEKNMHFAAEHAKTV